MYLMRHRRQNVDKSTDGTFSTVWEDVQTLDVRLIKKMCIPVRKDSAVRRIKAVISLAHRQIEEYGKYKIWRKPNIFFLDPLELGREEHLYAVKYNLSHLWIMKI